MSEIAEVKKKVKIQNIYPLTPMQEGMLYHSLLDQESTPYLEQAVLTLKGEVRVELFEEAFQLLVQRHDVLRTIFRTEKVERPVQIVLAEREAKVNYFDYSQESDPETAISKAILADKQKPFNLASEIPMRITILRKSADTCVVIWTHHHIIMDGWCFGIIISEFTQIYQALRNSQSYSLPPVIPYSNYIEWVQAKDKTKAEQYWSEYLSGYENQVLWPDHNHLKQNYKAAKVELKIEREVFTLLNSIQNELKVTQNIILQAAWGLVLQKSLNLTDVVFGAVVSGRPPELAGVEKIIGLFINTLPVRVNREGLHSFSQLCAQMQENALDANHHDFYPLAEIQAHTAQKGNLINQIMVFENFPVSQSGSDNHVGYIVEDFHLNEQTNYDLNIVVVPEKSALHVEFLFNANKYEPKLIAKLSSYFERILHQLVHNPQIALSDLKLLSEEEEQEIVAGNTAEAYVPQTILDKFRQELERVPNTIAIADNQQTITYKGLDELSDRIASYLISKGIKKEEPVAVISERSSSVPVAMLGIMKAGAAYLPIDASYPEERIAFMLNDSAVRIAFAEKFISGVEVLQLEELMADTRVEKMELPLVLPNTLAYIIYTSGSSGSPKGVMIEHAGVVNMIEEQLNTFDVKASRVLQVASISFDASVFEMLMALFSGSTLFICSRETMLDRQLFCSFIADNSVELMLLTPAFLNNLEGALPECVKILYTGGEAAKVEDVDYYKKKLCYINAYGPTEASIIASFCPIEADARYQGTIPIGRKVKNTSLYILDNDLKIVPDGCEGEICLGGIGLARGYINNPTLSAEKFIVNPYAINERLYRTGDLGRINKDELLEYFGRKDEQIKLRGHRIETGEIEARINALPGVNSSLILLNKELEALVAFYAGDKPLDEEQIRTELQKFLPAYMLPSFFVSMKEFPLTASGKIDRRKLPQPSRRERVLLPPSDEREAKLLEIWKELLNKEDISIDDNFFEIGGHSLKATLVISRIHKVFNASLPLKAFFDNPTIIGIAANLEKIQLSAFYSIPIAAPQTHYPLSSAQRRMYLLNQIEGASTAYNIPYVVQVSGILDPVKVRKCLQELVIRHESLRTTFLIKEGEMLQQVHSLGALEFKHVLMKEEELKAFVDSFVRPFSLDDLPLFRAAMIGISETKHLLLFDIHHIISDGLSMEVLIREFVQLYNGEGLKPLRIQYKDFASWQKDYLNEERLQKQLNFWKSKFSGEIPVLALHTDYPRPDVQQFNGNKTHYSLRSRQANAIKSLAKSLNVSVFHVIFSAYNVLLSRYSMQNDIVVGTPVSGRNHADLEGLVGMFVNMIPVRTMLDNKLSFEHFVLKFKDSFINDFNHSEVPFEEIVEHLNIPRDLSRNPLFDTVFSYQSQAGMDSAVGELNFSSYDFELTTSKFDLTFEAIENASGLYFNIEYSTHLFKSTTIDRFASCFTNLLDDIVKQPTKRLGELSISSAEFRQDLIEAALQNFTSDTAETVVQMFHSAVLRYPDNLALSDGISKLTYQQLDEKSDALAGLLMEKGLTKEAIVCILMPKSVHTIVSMLAVMKSGGAFCPIDSSYPAERIEFMLKDTNAAILLSTSGVPQPDGDFHVINVMEIEEAAKKGDFQYPALSQLAYVIYTSGSTGIPKGVMLEHGALANLVNWHNKTFEVSAKDNASQYASIAFDAAIWEIFPYLCAGAALHIIPDAVRLDMEQLNLFFQEKKITKAFLPTQVFEQYQEQDNNTLQLMLTGGDKLKSYRKKAYAVYNNYGPTENAVVSTFYKVADGEVNIPIGRAVDKTHTLILDAEKNIQPVGVPGEIYLGGKSLARGYWNREDLSRQKFISHPFIPGERIYPSGDLGRLREDGNIEYLGRIDQQVKIRGNRIEPGEIEAKLLDVEGIKEGLVLDLTDASGNKYLCAYYTSDLPEDLQNHLRKALSDALPEYMIPSYFVRLDTLPLTVSGKVDRKALPEPTIAASDKYIVKARGEIELALEQAWTEVLNVREISVTDNFFALGGDSIKAIQVLSRLYKAGYKIEVRELFKHPTIQQLAPFVKAVEGKTDQASIEGNVELTPIQQWFFERDFLDAHHWNQSVMLWTKDDLNEEALKQTLDAIVLHHDNLRSVFRKNEEGQQFQYIRPYNADDKYYLFSVSDFSESSSEKESIEKYAAGFQSKLDLENGPLLGVALYKTKEGTHIQFVVHHLVIDGVSWRIVLEDIAASYRQALSAEPIQPQDKTISFKSWSEKLKNYAFSKDCVAELSYWREVEKVEGGHLSADAIAVSDTINDGVSLHSTFTVEETALLLKKTNQAFNTEINDVLLTALAYSLKQFTGAGRHKILLEGHGREEITEGVNTSRTIGWFTSAYPVLLSLSEERDVPFTIRSIKEQLRHIPNKGISYGLLKYMAGFKEEFKDQPQISFNYLGQFEVPDKNALFASSPLSPGCPFSMQSARANCIDITCLVTDSKLSVSLNYNRHEFSELRMQQFLDAIKHHLLEIVKVCVNAETQPSPSDLGDRSIDLASFDQIILPFSEKLEKCYPLSPMQEGMLFQSLLNPHSEAYFEQALFSTTGNVDPHVFAKSLNLLAEKHEILRTSFISKGLASPRQVVFKTRNYSVEFSDYSRLSPQEQHEKIQQFKIIQRKQPFNLLSDHLMKVNLFKTAASESKILWSYHHILIDGWCLGTLMADFISLYNSVAANEKVYLEQPAPYSDYIWWLQKQDKTEAADYWRNYLSEYEQKTFFKSRNNILTTYVMGEQSSSLPNDTVEKLVALGVKYKVTLSTLFQAAWSVLLQLYSNSEDVVFGSVVSGRPPEVKGVEQMIGLFINTIPVRVQVKGNRSFKEIIEEIHQRSLESNRYTYLPLAEIQSLSAAKNDLINHIVLFTNLPIEKNEGKGKPTEQFTVNDVETYEQTNYDLNVAVEPTNAFTIRLKYNRNVFEDACIEGVLRYVQVILQQIADNPDAGIADVMLHSTQAPAAEPETEAGSFTEQFTSIVEKYKDKIALVSQGNILTYNELNQLSDKIAACLIHKHQLQPGQMVGLMMSRTNMLLPSIIGIIKAGGAYVPIDPGFPEERKHYIFKNSGLKIVLCDRDFSDGTGSTCINVSALDLNSLPELPALALSSSDLIYTTYTSGSTGLPKGVMIEHRNVVSFAKNFENVFGIYAEDTILALTNMTFDISVLETLCALLNGCSVVLASDEEIADPSKIKSVVKTAAISVAQFTPSRLKMMMDYAGPELFKDLKVLLVGGEALDQSLFDTLKQNDVNAFNVYGPTETTIWSTSLRIKDANELSIGVPLPGESLVILNAYGNVCPEGLVGELCISGTGVGRGYLGNDGLTKERFIVKEGVRLYKTGDLGRHNADGTIEFLGRKDHQVKIRGYRIELGEIENTLRKQEGLKDAVVIDKTDQSGTKYLAAFVVAEDGINDTLLKTHLRTQLPEYMIPSSFTVIKELPLTSSGKVDRKQLNELNVVLSATREEATTALQHQLVAIWKEVLELSAIGITDNFFELGGHSLKMIRIITRIQNELNTEVPLTVIFNYPNIRELASYIEYMNTVVLDNMEDRIVLLNQKRDKNIFFFPPMVGYAMIYHELARELSDYSVYGLLFIEEENRMDEYVKLITTIQPEGPYIFATYSAGGILTYEVAKEFIRRGINVTDIVLMDSYARREVEHVEDEERHAAIGYMYEGDPEEKPHLKSAYVRENLKRKVNAYFDYLTNTVTSEAIPVNIHLIRSIDEEALPGTNSSAASISRNLWGKLTNKDFKEYTGFGTHGDMLTAPHFQGNVNVLRYIFKELFL